jgi:hypothetical protein
MNQAGGKSGVHWLTIDVPQLILALQSTPRSSAPPSTHSKQVLPQSLQGAITHGLPAEICAAVGDVQVWSVAFTTVASASLKQLSVVSGGQQTPNKVGLAMILTTAGELLCVANGRVLYQRQLPLLPAAHSGQDVHMQFTSSARAPLLLVSRDSTLLVVDVLHNGAVLKEFTHVGAYICAPLLHPLEEHLMVIPASEVERLGVTQVTHGHVVCASSMNLAGIVRGEGLGRSPSKSKKTAAESQAKGLGLTDFFVYELPSGGTETGASEGCRSMNPQCWWREGEWVN